MKAGELLAPDCFKHTLARHTEESGRRLSCDQQLQEKGRKLKDYELMKQQVEEHAKTVVEQGNDKERSVFTYTSQICTVILATLCMFSGVVCTMSYSSVGRASV